MKKFNSVVIVFILLLTLLTSTSASTFTQQQPLTVNWSIAASAEELSNINNLYEITPNSDEWKTFQTKQELLDSCKLSQSILAGLSTNELLDAVLTYPLLVDLYAFDSYDIGLQILSENSDAYSSFLIKSDATQKLIERLNSTNEEEPLRKQTLEILLSDKRLLDTTTLQKIQQSPRNTSATVYTPKGSAVTVINVTSDFTDAEKISLNNSFKSAYPNATFIATSTQKYNCHNYAWNDSSPATYWMNDPSRYMTDGSYVSTTMTTATKVYYGSSANHSARIYAQNPPYAYPKVMSKWGQGPLMVHSANYGPYGSSNITYWKAS